MDRPETGGGDFETLAKILITHDVCANPALIDCRDSATLQDAKTGNQVLDCAADTGLRCINANNLMDGGCFDYEVRFYCACSKCNFFSLCMLYQI